jgi:SAM-dependent MidA family methyltransferase
MRFDHFMEAALYGPHGFYQRGHGAGTQRDFLTSPEVGSLFGAVFARRIDAEWDRLGQPSRFTVVEVGAGPGTLARTVFAAQPRCCEALHYVLVDRANGMRALHLDHLPVDRVRSVSEIPAESIVGLVIANELLDNVPTRLISFDKALDSWHEVGVRSGTAGELKWHREVLADFLLKDRSMPAFLVPCRDRSSCVPWQEEAGKVANQLLRLVERGSLILIDYMRGETAEFPTELSEWMRTYRRHQRGIDPLSDPGECDITVDVAVDQLVEAIGNPAVQRSQAEALRAWGIESVLAESAEEWARRSFDFDLRALRARSHASEAPILTDPTGLGGFTVMEWSK